MKDLDQIVTENNEFVVFAVQPHEPHTVMNFMADQGIPFQVLLGSYKGQLETSFIIPHIRLEAMAVSGYVDEQESILILGAVNQNGTRPARIRFLETGEELDLGSLTRVTKEEALTNDGWTFNPMINSYFTIKA